MKENFYVYILTNDRHTVLYTGVTSNLMRRLAEHKTANASFAARYGTHKLVYYEHTTNVEAAITREKQIKGGSRKKKVILIEAVNGQWKDLSGDLVA